MIDFAVIAAGFAGPFGTQTHGWPVLLDHLDKLVRTLDEQAGGAERATRAYPVLRYRNGAVGVRLALGPGPVLVDPDRPARGFGAALGAGVDSFVTGIGGARDAVDSELALPRLVGVLAEMVASVEASVQRFEHPEPAMFGPGRAFSDVFGLGALAWRTLADPGSQDQLWLAAGRAGITAGFLRSLSPASSPAAPQTSGTAGVQPTSTDAGLTGLVLPLESAAVLVLDGILLLPVAGLALEVLLTEGVLAVQTAMLREFGALERSVYDLRSGVVDAWLEGFDAGSTLHLYASAADLVVGVDEALLSGMFPDWLDGLLDGIQQYFYGLGLWAGWAEALGLAFETGTTDLMNLDLMPWVIRNTLGDWIADHVPAPEITLGDLVGVVMGENSGMIRARKKLDRFFDRVDDVLWAADHVFDVKDLRQKVADVATLLHIPLTPTPFDYPPDPLPTGPLAGFPDVYQDVFGGGRRAELLASVQGTGVALADGVHGWLTSAATLSQGLAGSARGELQRQARFGAGLRLGQRFEAESAVVTGLFGPLRDDLAARAAGEPADPLAEAFDATFGDATAVGGIAAAAAAVPAFAAELREFWRARSASAEYPTSAHLLARRGRLAAVRVPRLTVHAYRREPGRPLAAETADAFRGVVLGAYRDGRDAAVLAGGDRHGR